MFTDVYDGLKNYFTFTQFVVQDSSSLGAFHFTQMNYPFGEYIFFTDNTPLFALPLRFIHDNLISLDGRVVGLHNYIFILNIFLTPLLLYKVLEKWIMKPHWLVLLFCLTIAWINPQILKLSAGVYNLSLSSIMLIVILCMQSINDLFIQWDLKKMVKLCLAIAALIFFAAFIHLYYIPLIALPIGVFVFTLFLYYSFSKKQVRLKIFLPIVASVLIGGVGFYFLLQGIDGYGQLRNTIAQGFDWSFWRFTPEAIFTPDAFHSLPTPMPSIDFDIPYESKGFLGNFFWYSFLIFFLTWIYLLLSKQIKFKTVFVKLFTSPLYFALFFTLVISYAASSGTYVKLSVIPLGFDNFLSPFYFLHNKIDLITQFRCLGRFSWMGFWLATIFSILVFLKWQDYMKAKHAVLLNIILVFLSLVLIIDLKDAMLFQSSVRQHNLFNTASLEEKFDDIASIDFDNYQAALTIPATNVGSENYDFTIDDQSAWSSYWMQLSAYTKLPLFSCKMSRTALEQASAQIDLFRDQSVPKLILDKVNDQPILVVYSPEMEESYDLKIEAYAEAAVKNGSNIIKAFEMDTILESNNIYYLSWDIKNKH